MIDDYHSSADSAAIIGAYIGAGIYLAIASFVAAGIVALAGGATWALVVGTGILISAVFVMAGVLRERRHRHYLEVQADKRKTLIVRHDTHIAPRLPEMHIDDEPPPVKRELLEAPATSPRRALVAVAPNRMTLIDANEIDAAPEIPSPVMPKRETLLMFAALLELGRQPTFANALRMGMPNNSTEYKLAKDLLAAREWVSASAEGERTEWGEGICEPDALPANVEKLRAYAQRAGR